MDELTAALALVAERSNALDNAVLNTPEPVSDSTMAYLMAGIVDAQRMYIHALETAYADALRRLAAYETPM